MVKRGLPLCPDCGRRHYLNRCVMCDKESMNCICQECGVKLYNHCAGMPENDGVMTIDEFDKIKEMEK